MGAVIAVVAYVQWTRNQRALRHGEPLPRSLLPQVLAVTVTAMALVAAIIVAISALLKH